MRELSRRKVPKMGKRVVATWAPYRRKGIRRWFPWPGRGGRRRMSSLVVRCGHLSPSSP